MKEKDLTKLIKDINAVSMINKGENREDAVKDLVGAGELGKQLLELEKIKMLSELSPDLIHKFSVLLAVNSRLKSPILDSYINNFLELNVSKGRQGRKEIIRLSDGISNALALLIGNGSSGNDNTSFKDKILQGLNRG